MFKHSEEGDFIVRMFSEKPQKASAMDTQTTIEYQPKKMSQEEASSFDIKFKPFFDKVGGEDGEIDAFELQQVANAALRKELDGKEMSLEACRSMVAMVDRDRNGKLDYGEFRSLWVDFMKYKNNFSQYDKDGSGDMNAIELRDAHKKGNINIDDYIQICCRVRPSFESYLSYQGKAFSLDDYIMSAVYT